MDGNLSLLLLLAPLSLAASTLLTPALRRRLDPGSRAVERAAGLSLGLAVLTSVFVAFSGGFTSPTLGVGEVGLSLRLDFLSLTMFLLVSAVGLVVVRYARHYLDGDARLGDFQARLGLALGAVLLLVLAGNLVQLVLAWAGASLALHRLLVFFSDRPRAVIAGRKKMIVARLGDVCLVTAAILLAQAFDSTDVHAIAVAAQSLDTLPAGVGLAAFLLVAAAALKAAQFPFHGWLPEVMETPTPVSALLHAGMINSGGFLLLRFADVLVLEPGAMTALLAIGAVSAVFGSLVLLTQTTIKGTLAYSTLAQMGFMLLECGLGAFSVALLHIVAHSLYKAHAFLSAGGAVIHGEKAKPQALDPSRAALALMAGWVVALVATAAAVDLADPAWGASVTLATILAFGVVMWGARQLEGGGSVAMLGIAIGTPLLFVALKSGTGWLVGAGFPPPPALTTASGAVLLSTLLAFGAVAWAQLVGFPQGAVARQAYVVVRNGGWLGAFWDRWTGALRVRAQRGSDERGSATPASRVYAPGPSSLGEHVAPPTLEQVASSVLRAGEAVPPLWPLSEFVAVNPFLGHGELRFADASSWLERTAGARTTMPRAFYAKAIDDGEITRDDIAAAIEESGSDLTLESVERGVRKRDRELFAAPTVADVALGITGVDAPRLVVESIGSWAETYFDRGQAIWASPWKHRSPFEAWRAHARLDPGPALLGVGDLRAEAEQLPPVASDAITVCVARLGLSAGELDLYFQRLLLRMSGWAGHVRYRGWAAERAGEPPAEMEELLAIALAWEVVLLASDPRVENTWRVAKSELAASTAIDAELDTDLVLHRAFELANQRCFAAKMPGAAAPKRRPHEAQAVFCIDVRSERIRRCLEAAAPSVQTLGFAGFFGMAIEWVPLGKKQGEPYCPVLLDPAHVVRESAPGAGKAIAAQRFRETTRRAWQSFQKGAVSSFGFVETMGLGYAVGLVRDSLRRVPAQGHAHGHDLSLEMTLPQRIDAAEGALRAMSLTRGFAPLVALVAHGSTSKNNPYASGLDCGACGGRSGEPNARVAAALFNSPEVRAGLADRGIEIPDGTYFLAGVHDTTTDVVRICDTESVPAELQGDLARFQSVLEDAGHRARKERAPQLGIESGDEHRVAERAADWSQVRPEWGLAGCTNFVAAPRGHTADARLDGTFLHEYLWQDDREFRVLEQIMTAPLVVASWINLQYYASTVDNRAFGAGDKVLHNVAGGLGVVEGNGGDLRVGLPMQSVHDGQQFAHRPCRLTAAIAAPCEAMTRIIERNPALRDLLDQEWIHLVSLDDLGRVSHRYVGGSEWQEFGNPRVEEQAA